MVGKPAEFMLANIAEAFGMERKQICMVGDRLDTDILFGQDGGLSTMLVLSGMVPHLPGLLLAAKSPVIMPQGMDSTSGFSSWVQRLQSWRFRVYSVLSFLSRATLLTILHIPKQLSFSSRCINSHHANVFDQAILANVSYRNRCGRPF